jgi:hypothetical protein
MVTLVVAVAYFAAVYLGRRPRLRLLTQHILRSAKRIYGVPEFRFYAVADGIRQTSPVPKRGLGPPLLRPGDQFLLLPFEI